MANIRQTPNGNWQAQVRRRGIKPLVSTFKTKIEANRWARLVESELDRGVFLERSEGERTTMGELIDRYLLEVTPRKKSARREVLRLNELKRHFGRFSTSAVRFAIETGIRMGEVLSLTWRNVDLAQRISTLLDTKTRDGRQVPLSTAAIAAISSLPRHFSDERVFCTWQRADSLENAWRRAVKLAGLEDLRFHDLRHEAVSRLFELGLNPMEVASISGHKTLQMLKRYTHLRAADLVRKLR
jgi:integrase